MSHFFDLLLSRVDLFKTVVAGTALAASVAAHAVGVDSSAAPSHVGDPTTQVQTFDALVGFAVVPLSATEAETHDAERFRLRPLWSKPKWVPCAALGLCPPPVKIRF